MFPESESFYDRARACATGTIKPQWSDRDKSIVLEYVTESWLAWQSLKNVREAVINTRWRADDQKGQNAVEEAKGKISTDADAFTQHVQTQCRCFAAFHLIFLVPKPGMLWDHGPHHGSWNLECHCNTAVETGS